jgi:hypothetical protein
MNKSKYPKWICNDCGTKYGSWYQPGAVPPKSHMYTSHVGNCNVCGLKDVVVTEPRDYGYLISGWDNKRIKFRK